MTEYKDSLNLPHTEFAMKANLALREPAMVLEFEHLYADLRLKKASLPSFVLHDGPPYANGHLHCGHALNKILKDMVVKSKNLAGLNASFIPGWDCHGLPIELNVEKKFGKSGHKLSHKEFRQKCREYAQSQIAIQRDEFKRLGIIADFANPYITMDYSYEANIIRAFALILQNGHIKQGFKPVHWCVDCASALAEAEVDYIDKSSDAIDVAFYVDDAKDFCKKFVLEFKAKIIVAIWTTTPWTLPANEAVCLHKAIEYAVVLAQDYYYVIASDLVETVMQRFGISAYKIIKTILGSELEGLQLTSPLYDQKVPIVLADYVTTDTGTGCVHTAPAHGPDDYVTGVKYNLPCINPVLDNGCYSANVEFFAGLHVSRAGPVIIEHLKSHAKLLAAETINHSYPCCWRHKTPIIFRTTPQWFIAMDANNLRSDLLNSLDMVDWIPDWGKARIHDMIAKRPDWCISRQRSWGTPIPVFLHKETRDLHPRTAEFLEIIAVKVEGEGIDAWFDLEIEELLGSDAEHYVKGSDTLDVWFDSGVSHTCVLKDAQYHAHFPADIYLEGSDQHRGWFNSSITTAMAMHGKPPYRQVLTHGYTVDSSGRKLSKSLGNYVALDELIAEYGADVLRLWAASVDFRNEASISKEVMQRSSDAYRRIRNTARFLLSNLFDFDPSVHLVSHTKLVELDKYIVKKAANLQAEVIELYAQYQFHVIYQKIHNFCTVDLGSFYLDIIKDRQYTCATESLARRSCQTAMYHLLEALTRLLAPILSFTAAEIWQHIPGKRQDSLFAVTWYDFMPQGLDVSLDDWDLLQEMRAEVNKALEEQRKAGLLGSALAAIVNLRVNSKLFNFLAKFKQELRFVFITAEVNVSLDSHVNGFAVSIDVATAPKCARCWHRVADIGQDIEHPELCLRCVGNIGGQPETREFA
jgi:isoleucyl-tRNA synthetase